MPRAAALLALAAVLPALAVATVVGPNDADRYLFRPMPGTMCGTQGRYALGSAYESNLIRLAASVVAEVNGTPCNCSCGYVAGELPDQVSASTFCYLRFRPRAGAAVSESSDCGACVALAFREAWRRCLFHRQAMVVVDGGACSVSFHDVHRMEQRMRETHHVVSYNPECARFPWFCNAAGFLPPDVLLVVMFQAAGLACVVFLFLQEWRATSRGPTIHSNDYLPVTGDQ